MKNLATFKNSLIITEPEDRRHQARLLLVSLIENFCALYSPEEGHALFVILCRRLAEMRIITSDDCSEDMASVRSMYISVFKNLVSDALAGLSSKPALLECEPSFDLSDIDFHSSSRYLEDFLEIKLLGRGAYGSVWHVKHKLDESDYAVKKIRLWPIKHFQDAIKEAQVLAVMDSPNIVRYYSAWLEFEHESKINDKEPDTSYFTMESIEEPEEKPLVLFIQMELCSATLHQYLQYRNQLPEQDFTEECAFIFTSLLNAVSYIHKRCLAHRDLTPKNIFLVPRKENKIGQNYLCEFTKVSSYDQLLIKVGDFGLVSGEKISDSSPSSPVGTPLYSAPEVYYQQRSRSSRKSDMYSLGVILFELCYPFTTSMERQLKLTDLREQNLPTDLIKKYPQQSAVILWLTAADPEQRPNADDLFEFFSSSHHLNDSDSLRKIIEQQKQDLAQKDLEISKLKNEIQELKNK